MTEHETRRDPLRVGILKGGTTYYRGDEGWDDAVVALRAALASSTPDAPWPSLADFRRMSPPEVNAFLASRGATIRVRDDSSTQDALDAPCQHQSCTEVFESDSPAGESIMALAWALAELSADGPHGSNERRRFRPLAREFFQALFRDPRRAESVRDALTARLAARGQQ